MNQGWMPTYSRRTFLHSVMGSLGLGSVSSLDLTAPDNSLTKGVYTEPATEGRLFAADLPEGQWVRFRAAGYPQPVTGIIYRKRAASYFSSYVERPWPVSGMPLGGIDTGALYLEPSGVLGYSSIFNHITPIGGPLNTPYLAIATGGRSWVLGTGQTKNYAGNNRPSLGINVGGSMQESAYWGHYPIADVEYTSSDAPVEISVRSWSPFIPGDVKASNIPGAVFEVHLRNKRNSAHKGCLVFNFPGFADHHSRNYAIGWPNMPMKPVMPPQQISRRSAPDGLKGVWVEEKSWGMSYVLAALAEDEVRTGGALGFDGATWDAVEKNLPSTAEHDGGSSVAVDYEIGPAEEKVIRIILAWYAPEWEGNGNPGTGGKRILTYAPEGLTLSTTGKRFTHMYATRFADAGEVAQYLARNHERLLKRIIAWQSVIYEDKELTGWLADALINSFYYFAPCSLWAQAKDPIGDWCRPEDGLFALEESPRACSHVSTLSNLAMAGPLLSLFFPELHVSALKAVRATQRSNGDLAQLLGRWADPANPMSYDYQEVVVGACYMVQAYWHWKIHGDDEFLKDFYPSAKKALNYSFSQRPDLGLTQIIAMPPYRPHTWNDSDWFEDRSYYGYVADAGGFRLAAAEMLREWAEKIGDIEEVKKLDEMLAASKEAMQKYLWKSDHYLVYNDPKTGKKLDAFFTPSLNGQYFARFCGVPGVFPPENIEKMIVTLRDRVCKISKLGMPPLYSNPDGTLWKQNDTGYLTGEYIYTNHQVIWNAILAMYEGHHDFGLDLLHKNLELSYCKWGYMWDGANCCSAGGDTGEVNYGWDYWFNWSIWTAAAALLNRDITALVEPGGLASKVIAAGRTGEPS